MDTRQRVLSVDGLGQEIVSIELRGTGQQCMLGGWSRLCRGRATYLDPKGSSGSIS